MRTYQRSTVIDLVYSEVGANAYTASAADHGWT